jgi:hypothetical protein
MDRNADELSEAVVRQLSGIVRPRPFISLLAQGEKQVLRCAQDDNGSTTGHRPIQ